MEQENENKPQAKSTQHRHNRRAQRQSTAIIERCNRNHDCNGERVTEIWNRNNVSNADGENAQAPLGCEEFFRNGTLLAIGWVFLISSVGAALSQDVYTFMLFRLLGGGQGTP